MKLIGQPIKHKAFGHGAVTDLSDGIVTTCFENYEKRFISYILNGSMRDALVHCIK